jgi:glycosyltransferase involved in cell wall biosynthesis
MPLTVLSIAFPFAPVGPHAVGGTEQILSDLDEALVAAGHKSLVVACEGSQPAGKLFPVALPRRDVLEAAEISWSQRRFQAAIDLVLARHRVDLIHMHGMDFDRYRLPSSIPVLVTLHMPIGWYRPQVWKQLAGRVQFCCVSETQRRCLPAELLHAEPRRHTGLPGVTVIQNGVTIPELSPNLQKEEFAIVLGRICPEKNAHEALAAGSMAGVPVLVGGHVFPYKEHKQYFAEKLQPLLEERAIGVQHEFLGPLEPARRWDLLARAKCLLHPTLAPETSSLVAMEALAAGTPVIAYRSGALPEIVEDGVTGFLVDSVESMAAALRNVHRLSAQECRGAAEQRFAKERMVRRYFELYEAMTRTAARERLYA